ELASIVRTFHSLAFSQAMEAGLQVSTIDSLDMPTQGGGDLPFPPLGIPEDGELANMLNEVACRLMRENELFRRYVMEMYKASFIASSANAPDRETLQTLNKRIGAVQARDRDRTLYMETVWRERFAPGL